MSYDDADFAPPSYFNPNKRGREDGMADALQAGRLPIGFQAFKATIDGHGIVAQLVRISTHT